MQSQSLKEYRWEKRIIILVSGKDATISSQKQLEALVSKKSALEERDLILFLLNKHSVVCSNKDASQIDAVKLRKELKIDGAFEGVILIGKDSGVKMREEFHVEPQKIFDLIDSMPMRQTEMKN